MFVCNAQYFRDMKHIPEIIEDTLRRLPPDAARQLEAVFTQHRVKKGTMLMREGQYCRHLFWLESGVTRAFVLHEGREVTTNFAFADDLIVSLRSALLEQPSREAIQMLETGQVASVEWAVFKKLTKIHPALAELDSLFSDLYALQLEERVLDLQTLSARQRYEKLRAREPHIVAQIPLTHIASYLGISLETLSRIRAKA